MNLIMSKWNGQTLDIDEASLRIDAFAREYGSKSAILAAHASVLEQIRPELLALLRKNFLSGADKNNASLDADVLYGPLVWNLGGGYFEMDREIRKQLLISLDAWGSRHGDTEIRSRRIARFVRHYVSWARRSGGHTDDNTFEAFLNRIDWVALAFDEPEAATASLFVEVNECLKHSDLSTYGIRFGGVTALLELPIPAFVDELDYARAIDVLRDHHDNERFEKYQALISRMFDRKFHARGIELPSARQILVREKRTHELQLSTKGQTDAKADTTKDAADSASIQSPAFNSTLSDICSLTTDQTTTNSPLHIAVKSNNTAAVEKLLETNPELIDLPDAGRQTALHLAVERDCLEIVDLLIHARADINIKGKSGATPLRIAAENGRLTIAEKLISRHADIEAITDMGSTPLHAACYYGHKGIVELLIKHNAVVDATNYKGNPPIFMAAFAGRRSIFKLLLNEGARLDIVSRNGHTALYWAAAGGELSIVEQIINRGTPINVRDDFGWTPFLMAAYSGHTDITEYFIELGADPVETENSGWSALHLASQQRKYEGTNIEGDHSETIQCLLNYGVDINSRLLGNVTALYVAASCNADKVARTLLSQDKVHVNTRKPGDWTPLLCAASLGHAEVLKELMRNPAVDVAAENNKKSQALTLAIEAKSVTTVETLLTHPGIDRNHVDTENSKPPLWLAADLEQRAIISRIANDPKTNINWSDVNKNTLLHLIASKKQHQLIKLLLTCEADINALNKWKNTPLIHAIQASDKATTELLLKAGASPNKYPEDAEKSPMQCAIEAGSIDCIRLLSEHGANLQEVDAHASTLLHKAAELSSPIVVDLLLSLGLSLEALNRDGMTPVHSAVHSDNTKTALELLQRCDNIEDTTLQGWTALHLAAQRNFTEIVEALINRNVTLNPIALDPMLTPLQAAAQADASGTCQLLLKAGADPDLAVANTAAPVVLAVTNGHFETAILLLKSGAKITAIDPKSGTSLQAFFEHRLAIRKRLGDEKPSSEHQLALLLYQHGQQDQPEQRVPHDMESASDDGQTSLDVGSTLKFAPLAGLNFDNPQAPVSPPWRVLTTGVLSDFINRINDMTGEIIASVEDSQVCWSALPFYEKAVLLRVRDRSWPYAKKAIFYLEFRKDLYRLNGQALPIHKVNVKDRIKLNEDNVLDYLRFFSFFVRGEEGPFHILESIQDPTLSDISDPAILDTVEKHIEPANFKGIDNKGNFLADAVCAYSAALFRVSFNIQKNGNIKMLNDTHIIFAPIKLIDAPLR